MSNASLARVTRANVIDVMNVCIGVNEGSMRSYREAASYPAAHSSGRSWAAESLKRAPRTRFLERSLPVIAGRRLNGEPALSATAGRVSGFMAAAPPAAERRISFRLRIWRGIVTSIPL